MDDRTTTAWKLRVALAAACLFACAPQRAPPETLRLGVATIPVYALLFVAEDEGLFAAEGLEVEVVRFTTGRDAIPPLTRDQLDAATIYTTPILLTAMERHQLVGFTTLHRARALSGLVSREAAGIRTYADLRGKRIGVTPNTSADFLLDLLLAEGGLLRSDVTLVPGDPGELRAALGRGELDGCVLWAQHFLSAQPPDGGTYRRLTSEAYSEISFLVTTRATYERRKTAFLRLLRALAAAERRIGERPALARAAIRERFPELTAPQLDEVVRQARFEIGLSNLALFMLRQEGVFLQQLTGREAPDVTALLNPELVRAVAPETVTALLDPPPPAAPPRPAQERR